MTRKQDSRAELILFTKQALNSGLLVERKIWRIPKSHKYPEGVKYRLVLVDPTARVVILLYDNHYPKGPHVHWGQKERPYEYNGLEKLLNDFLQESNVEEERYNEDKKNTY